MYVCYKLIIPAPCILNPLEQNGLLQDGDSKTAVPAMVNFFEQIGELKDTNLKFICIGDVISRAMYANDRARPFIKYMFYNNDTRNHTSLYTFHPNFDLFEYETFTNRVNTISAKIMYFIFTTIKNDKQYVVEIQGDENALLTPCINFTCAKDPHYVLFGRMNTIKAPAGCGCVITTAEFRKISAQYFKDSFVRCTLE